ncbi:hypothetical protein theurythT_20330 [Thalassotalea eurytherma]|uniref:IS30 family transposase n=1 Tax=Thalassotalea eurytherma TaxID=1144278 RepID=A0ABQ6H809_9GAMM|nr:hypothetical protein theurythT_20330 [Thalassotalea eurytherma]
MKRTFTAQEKEFVFDSWKQGKGFSDIANLLDSKPGTISLCFGILVELNHQLVSERLNI